MKSAAALLVVAAMLGLAGCLPTSVNPLSAPADALADARLAGVWYGKSGEDTIFLHFVADKEGMTDIVEVDHQQNEGAHSTIYTMFPTVIDGHRYMNIREKKSNGGTSAYYIARYSISDSGALTIWMMSEKPAASAVQAEKLAGKIKVTKAGDRAESRDVSITATTEALAAFVRKSDPETLFAEKFGTFKKLTLPVIDTPAPAATPAVSPSPTPAKSTKKPTPAKPKSKPKATPKKKKSGG